MRPRSKTLADPRNPLIERARSLCLDLQTRALTLHSPWGFKDPRSSLTWPFWKRVLPNARIIISVRDPLEVAASLKARNQLTMQFGLRLCNHYFESLLASTGNDNVLVAAYATLVERPVGTLKMISEWLNLSPSDDRLRSAVASIRPEFAHQRQAKPQADQYTEAAFRNYADLVSRAKKVTIDDILPPATAGASSSLNKAQQEPVRGEATPLAYDPERDKDLDTQTYLEHANALWRQQKPEQALDYYLAALTRDRTSTRVARQFVNFMLIHLSNGYAGNGEAENRKRMLRAFLCIEPRNRWALAMIVRLGFSPYDDMVFRELEVHAEQWDSETKTIVKRAMEALEINANQHAAAAALHQNVC